MSIAVAGNIIVDTIKSIDTFPKKLSLAAILDVKRSLGGAVNNTGIDLARLAPDMTMYAIGYVGEDENGDFALDTLKSYPNIDTSGVKRSGVTSFCDVMTEPSGERTFFTYKGADSLLTADDFNFENAEYSILHLAYIMLLHGMDAPDAEYGTMMARTLAAAQAAGILTSIDVVSENSSRFKTLVPPAMKYTDFCTVNEFEAERITGVPLRCPDTDALLPQNMRNACETLKGMGLRRWATIHAPEGAFGVDEKGRYTEVPSLKVPPEMIKGTVGAGDAFAAGLLYAAHEGQSHAEAIEAANAVAATSLTSVTASDAVRPMPEIWEFIRRFK